MKNFLCLTSFFLLIAATSKAADEPVVTCKGSAFANMKGSESYTIALTDHGNVVVRGENKTSRSFFFPINTAEEVVRNDDKGLVLAIAKKRVGMIFSKQTVDVDYRTGKGKVTDQQLLDGTTQDKVLYLASCQR